MGYDAWSESGYGIFLEEEDIEKIKTYLKDNDSEYTAQDEAWWYYLKEYKFHDIVLHSNGVDYRSNGSVVDSWGCYIGTKLWKPLNSILKEALKNKIIVPDKVNKKWKTLYAFLKKCGIKRRKPSIFSYVVTG